MTTINVHIQRFNDRIKVLNQTRGKDLTMSADDARNLHASIFDLLAQIAALSEELTSVEENSNVISVNMDGGTWGKTT